jgi:pyruvate kinase
MEELLDASDGVLIARSSLGLSISPQKVALAQNVITTRCKIRGKVGICSSRCNDTLLTPADH